MVYRQRCLVVTWLVSRETAAVSAQAGRQRIPDRWNQETEREFQTDGTKKPNERSPKDFKLRFGISLEDRRVHDVRYVLSEQDENRGRGYEGGMGWVEQRCYLYVNSRFLVR